MTWFEKLTGFCEESPDQVRRNLTVEGEFIVSRVNGMRWAAGRLETPSLGELRERVAIPVEGSAKVSVGEWIGDVQELHLSESNAGAMFQVASQFNLLEMVAPSITPERGVGIYENDATQGPACAVAAGAGTIYRNYFAQHDGSVGQSATCQIDCLNDVGAALGNSNSRLWEMKNGYALATRSGLIEISDRLRQATIEQRDALRKLLRVGIQWDTQVTLDDCRHRVSQVYGSALPVAYSNQAIELWEPFARLVLEASYEATVCAAILNAKRQASRKLFLTLLGGGAFGNELDWIVAAIERAVTLYRSAELDIAIVSYRSSRPEVSALIKRVKS